MNSCPVRGDGEGQPEHFQGLKRGELVEKKVEKMKNLGEFIFFLVNAASPWVFFPAGGGGFMSEVQAQIAPGGFSPKIWAAQSPAGLPVEGTAPKKNQPQMAPGGAAAPGASLTLPKVRKFLQPIN